MAFMTVECLGRVQGHSGILFQITGSTTSRAVRKTNMRELEKTRL